MADDKIRCAAEVIGHSVYGLTEDERDTIARALADAGLLALAPLTEEWATLWRGIVAPAPSRVVAERRVHGEDAQVIHRYVTEWEPVRTRGGIHPASTERTTLRCVDPDRGVYRVEAHDRVDRSEGGKAATDG